MILLLSVVLAATPSPHSWTEPVEPFHIVGNIHYVGTAELASYLLTTDEGHILLDVPLEENVPRLVASIEKLGFQPKDIRIIINSHAHFDHAGGIRAMKDLSGARVLMSAPDAALAARGGAGDFAFGDTYTYPPVQADEIIGEGSTVSLGGTILTALMTPGHTKGGTTWTTRVKEGGREYRVVFANSMTAPTYRLAGNTEYPSIMDDFRASFARLRQIEADVFLTTHVSFFGLDRKQYMDATALDRYVTRISTMVEKQYDEQSVAQVLDALHDAAAKADGNRYFDLFDRTAVYIGTDAAERWTLKEFRGFAEPYFAQGRGWTYVPTSRHVSIAPDRTTAWFDEILENEKYGTTRGTGVLLKRADEWKIVQYHLTIPVPNELAAAVVKMIRAK